MGFTRIYDDILDAGQNVHIRPDGENPHILHLFLREGHTVRMRVEDRVRTIDSIMEQLGARMIDCGGEHG